MKITVAGGGNIGLCLIGEVSRLHAVEATLFCSTPDRVQSPIMVEDREKGITYPSGPFLVTNNIQEAFAEADVVLCTYPAFMRQSFLDEITPVVHEGTAVGFFPAYGGAEFFCAGLLAKNCTVFGLQKVPYVARTGGDGNTAGIWSRKSELLVGAIPQSRTNEICRMLESLILIRCVPLSNYMQATLLPGNPLLHTCGSVNFLENYSDDLIFDEPFYYYREWDDKCSETICAMSDEMMAICQALPIDLSQVKSIQDYYESPTPQALTKKFHSIPSYADLLLPTTKTENGYKPDFSSRFFTEDIPFGVATLKALSLIAKIPTPTIDSILSWYKNVSGKEYFTKDGGFGKDIGETAIPQLFGIESPEALAAFYSA